MKKQFIYFFSAIMLSTFSLTSCKDNGDDMPIAENEIPNGFVKVSLSVQIIPSSIGTASTKKVSGLSKAKVTVSQANNKKTIEVDESGIAVFPDLFEGPVSVYVEAEGYASYNTTHDLFYDGSLDVESGIDTQVPGFARLPIILPRLASKVRGTVIGDWDFNNNTPVSPLTATEAKVFARVSSNYQPSVYSATLANGVFTFSDLPEGIPVTFELDYSSVDTSSDPDQTVDWEINISSNGLRADQTKEFGNVPAGLPFPI
jgi:hypothetical protein